MVATAKPGVAGVTVATAEPGVTVGMASHPSEGGRGNGGNGRARGGSGSGGDCSLFILILK